jgi:hypothetical protein
MADDFSLPRRASKIPERGKAGTPVAERKQSDRRAILRPHLLF